MDLHSSTLLRQDGLRAGSDALVTEFVATPDLGQKEWKESRQYAAVTIMFAIHYFFDSEEALKQLLHNVVINLRPGMCPLGSGRRSKDGMGGRRGEEAGGGGGGGGEHSLHVAPSRSTSRVGTCLVYSRFASHKWEASAAWVAQGLVKTLFASSYLPVRLVTAIRKAVRVSSAARLALCLRRWVWVVQEAIPTE